MEKKVKAKNGLQIYYYENEALHRFCMTLYIKAGILYEKRNGNHQFLCERSRCY